MLNVESYRGRACLRHGYPLKGLAPSISSIRGHIDGENERGNGRKGEGYWDQLGYGQYDGRAAGQGSSASHNFRQSLPRHHYCLS